MKILGLDISSSSTGWATLTILQNGNYFIEFGIVKPLGKCHGAKLQFFEDQFEILLQIHKPDLIAIEDLWVGKFALPAMVLSRYRGIVEKICWKWFKTEPLVRTATDFRKLLGLKYQTNLLPGKKEKLETGKDSKQLTFELICREFDLKLDFETDNDATDAIAVALGAHLIGTDLGKAADAEVAAKKAIQKAKKKAKREGKKNAVHP